MTFTGHETWLFTKDMEKLRQNTNYGEGQGTVFGILYLDVVSPSFYHMMAAAY